MVLEQPLYMQANATPAKLDRQFIADVFDVEGVLNPASGALKVTPRAAGANMSVDLAPGPGIIAGDGEAGQGSYRVGSSAVENLPIGAAPGSNSRIDLVIARIRDATVSGGTASDWVLEVLPGAVAVSPVAPPVPASAIPLAQVLVAAGVVSIDAAKITDRRVAAGNAAYVLKAGGSTIGWSDPSVVGLILKAAAGQARNRQEWRNAEGAADARINAKGALVVATTAAGSENSFGGEPLTGARLTIHTAAAGATGLVVRGFPGQTAPLQEHQLSSGIPVVTVKAAQDTTNFGSFLRLDFASVGSRDLLIGGSDSAGVGFRSVRALN